MASNIEEKKKLYGMKTFTGLPYQSAGNVKHGNDNVFLDSTSLNNTFGQMVDNDLHLMHAFERTAQINDGPQILPSDDAASISSLETGAKFMTPAGGSSVFAKKKLSLAESFKLTVLPNGELVELIAPVGSGRILVSTASSTYIVDVNDIKDATVEAEDEVFLVESTGQQKSISVQCISTGSFSQTLFGGHASPDSNDFGLFILEDGKFTRLFSLDQKVVSISWVYKGSTLAFASDSRVWTGNFDGSTLSNVKRVLTTQASNISESSLKAFGKITAVQCLEDDASAEDQVLVFTDSGDILQNSIVDGILTDEDWKVMSSSGVKVNDFAWLQDSSGKTLFLATSSGLMVYDQSSGQMTLVSRQHTSPVSRLCVHDGKVHFGDESGAILQCGRDLKIVEFAVLYDKITDVKIESLQLSDGNVHKVMFAAIGSSIKWRLYDVKGHEFQTAIDDCMSAHIEVDAHSLENGSYAVVYAVGEDHNGDMAFKAAKMSNIKLVDLDDFAGVEDVHMPKSYGNYSSIASLLEIQGMPYAVMNCFSTSDKLAQLSAGSFTDSRVKCIVTKFNNSATELLVADDTYQSALARGAVKCIDGRSFILLASDGTAVKYDGSGQHAAKLSAMNCSIADGSIIIDSKAIDDTTYAIVLSSYDTSKRKPVYSFIEAVIDFESGQSYEITSYQDINCPSEVLADSGMIHILSGRNSDFTDAKLKSFAMSSEPSFVDVDGSISYASSYVDGKISTTVQQLSLDNFYSDTVGHPLSIIPNGEAILDNGLYARRGDLVYNGSTLYAMQSFIGYDDSEFIAGYYIRSQRTSLLSSVVGGSVLHGYSLSQVKKNSHAALVGAKASSSATSSTFFLAYLRQSQDQHDYSFDSKRAINPAEVALKSDGNAVKPFIESGRVVQISSIADLVQNSTYADSFDISKHSELGIVERIQDYDTATSSNMIYLLMYGQDGLARMSVKLSSDASSCKVILEDVETVLSEHDILQMQADENAVYLQTLEGSNFYISAFPIGETSDGITSKLSSFNLESQDASLMSKSCIPGSDYEHRLSSSMMQTTTFYADSLDASHSEVTSWNEVSDYVQIDVEECINVVVQSSKVYTFKSSSGQSGVSIVSSYVDASFSDYEIKELLPLKAQNNEQQDRRFCLNNFIETTLPDDLNDLYIVNDKSDSSRWRLCTSSKSNVLMPADSPSHLTADFNWFTRGRGSIWAGKRSYIDGKKHSILDETTTKYDFNGNKILSVVEVDYIQSDGTTFIDTGIKVDPANTSYSILLNVLSDGVNTDYGISSLKNFAVGSYSPDEKMFEYVNFNEPTYSSCFYGALFGVQPYERGDFNSTSALLNNPFIAFADNKKSDKLTLTIGHPSNDSKTSGYAMTFANLKFNTFNRVSIPALSAGSSAFVNSTSADNKHPLSDAEKDLYNPFWDDNYLQDCNFWLLNANVRHNKAIYDNGWNLWTWFSDSSTEKHQSPVYSGVKHWHQQLKDAKIYDGQSLVFDGVPVRVISDGTDGSQRDHGCLYDRVSKKLFFAQSFALNTDGARYTWLKCSSTDLAYEYDLDYIHLNGQQVIDTQLRLSADQLEYDIVMAVSPDGMDLSQKNNWCYDNQFYRGMFGGIYKPTTTNDYSLYVDAVNTDLSGNAVSSGVRLGFYNLSTSTASNLAKQQSSWSLSVGFNEFYHMKTARLSYLAENPLGLHIYKDGSPEDPTTSNSVQFITKNKKVLGAQRFLIGSVGVLSGDGISGASGWPMNVKSATIKQNGVLVADLVPVVKDKQHCMYDKIRKTFFYPLSSNTSGKTELNITSCDTLSVCNGNAWQQVDDSTNFGATSPCIMSWKPNSSSDHPYVVRLEKTGSTPQYTSSFYPEIYADAMVDGYVQTDDGSWEKRTSQLMSRFRINSTGYADGQICHSLCCTAPALAAHALDLTADEWLKHPVLSYRITGFAKFMYAQQWKSDVGQTQEHKFSSDSTIGRLASDASDGQLSVVVPELRWNNAKLCKFYFDQSTSKDSIQSAVVDIKGVSNIVFPADRVDVHESAVVMSYDGRIGIVDESRGLSSLSSAPISYVNSIDIASIALSGGSIDLMMHDDEYHIIGTNSNSTYDISFTGLSSGNAFIRTGVDLGDTGAKHILPVEQKNTYIVATDTNVIAYSHDAPAADAIQELYTAESSIGDMRIYDNGECIIADGCKILSSSDLAQWTQYAQVGQDGTLDNVYMIDEDIYAVSKSGCFNQSEDGMYTSRYTTFIQNQTQPFNDLCATSIYEKNEDDIYQMCKDAMSAHVLSMHESGSTAKTLEEFMPVSFSIPDGFTTSASSNEFYNDYIERILTGSSVDGDVIALVKNNIATFGEWAQTSCWYIAKCWKSGIVDMNIFIPSTSTYYVPHVHGAGSCKSSPSQVIVNGIQTKSTINDNTTEVHIQIQSQYFYIDQLLANTIKGSSLPLMIHKDDDSLDGPAAKMFHSYVQPSIAGEFSLKQDDNQYYSAQYFCFGSDAQSIQVTWYDTEKNYAKKSKTLILRGNGGKTSSGYEVVSLKVLEGSTVVIPDSTFTYPGGVFIGWSTDVSPVEPTGPYQPGVELSYDDIDAENVVLNACWSTYEFTDQDTYIEISDETSTYTIAQIDIDTSSTESLLDEQLIVETGE